jgi:general secretion pathway protein G
MLVARRESGFTIVELLVVIVVIAILAAITIVAYNGIQARANDSRIRQAAEEIQKAAQLYVADYGPLPTGLGYYATTPTDCTASSGGWAAKVAYTHNCTLEYVLNSKGLLPANYMTNLPKNKTQPVTNGMDTFMFYRCTAAGSGYYVLMWYLESPSDADTSNFNAMMTKCSYTSQGFDTNYGMRAAAIIALS